MRAMTGTGQRRMASHARCVRVCSSSAPSGVRSFISAISAPAMKALSPAPVSTTARNASSSDRRWNVLTIARLPGMPTALRFDGLFAVTYATRPASRSSMRTRTSSSAMVVRQLVLHPARNECRLAERLERLVAAREARFAQRDEDFRGGGLAPEPVIDSPGGEISRLRSDRFVVVRLNVVAGAFELDARARRNVAKARGGVARGVVD